MKSIPGEYLMKALKMMVIVCKAEIEVINLEESKIENLFWFNILKG